MSKTIKNSFNQKLTFEKLIEAHNRASIGKKNKKEIIIFEMDLETNIIYILNLIKEGKYRFGKYREFIIHEPKERVIKSLPYQDRIVHQWYIEEFIKPFFYKRFIKDTYACLDNRGTHKAVEQVQKYMRKMQKKYGKYYVLKCDIHKYFYSIDKEILYNILSKSIKDKKLLEFSKLVLDDGEKIGIPIGNFTSQYFANIYLNDFDHYIKENLHIKYYCRYMDDFIIFIETKKEAKHFLQQVGFYLNKHLRLKLNKKSKYFPNYHGIDFCGYRIFETHILLRKRFKRKLKKSLILWKKLKTNGKLNQQRMLLSWNSYKGHASHSNSYAFIEKYKKKICGELENLEEKELF